MIPNSKETATTGEQPATEGVSLVHLVRRAAWPLAIKALPALYGAGLVLFVIRVLPPAEFGRYGVAFAYINFWAGISRGLWLPPLISLAAIGRQSDISHRSLAFAFTMAAFGAGLALVLLPYLHTGLVVAVESVVILFLLVPRDYALGLAQAKGAGRHAFAIESTYFLGALTGFSILVLFDRLDSATNVLIMNAAAAALSASIGAVLYPVRLTAWNFAAVVRSLKSSRWLGAITIGDMALQQGDVLLAGLFYAPSVIAPYIAARTLTRFYTLFSQAASFIILPMASRLNAAGELRLLRIKTETAIGILLCAVIPLNVGMWIAGEWLIPSVMGSGYAQAVPYFQVLILITVFEPVYSIVTNTMVGAGRPSSVAPVTWIGVIVNLAGLLWVLSSLGIAYTPYSMVVTYLVLAVGSLYVLRSELDSKPPNRQLR